jgi:putative intracellular protease/amidase
MNSEPIAHLAVYDTMADSEVGHLLSELHSGRFTGTPFVVTTVAESNDPITTMGGMRIVPDVLLADLAPTESDLLILPGAEMWDAGAGQAFADAAARFLDAGVPVAAICAATGGTRACGTPRRSRAHERGSGVPCGDRIPWSRPLS